MNVIWVVLGNVCSVGLLMTYDIQILIIVVLTLFNLIL